MKGRDEELPTAATCVFTLPRCFIDIRDLHSTLKSTKTDVKKLQADLKKSEDLNKELLGEGVRTESRMLELERVEKFRDGYECIVCMDRPREIFQQACGHFLLCAVCATATVHLCPVCRPQPSRRNEQQVKVLLL